MFVRHRLDIDLFNKSFDVCAGNEMRREPSGLSSSPPSADAKPLLDGMRLLEGTPTNNMVELAFSFNGAPTGLSLMLTYGVLCACGC